MNMIAHLSSKERTILWALGACRQMQIWGLMTSSGRFATTIKGLAVWDHLDAEWKPTNDGLRAAIANAIAPGTNPNTQTGIYVLLTDFRDNRERMHEYATGTKP